MAHSFNESASTRRINAYTDFLMAAYGTDADGLADLAGVDRDEMREYVTADTGEKNAAILQSLGKLTGISFSWLYAESGGSDPRKVEKATGKGAAIDPDDLHDTITSVKACAAALTALYIQDAGRIVYDVELFELLAGKLHEAAHYLDGVLKTL